MSQNEQLTGGIAEAYNPPLIEVAGALQSVYNSLAYRDFVPDIQQDQAVEAAGIALLQGKRRGHFEMATGTGKTLVEVVLAEAAVQAGKRVLMLAPSLQTADQIYGADGETGFGRFTGLLQAKKVRRHYGTKRANDKAEVVIMTYAGLLEEAENGRLGNFDVILADECHRGLGEKTSKVLNEYMPEAVRYGFSATPDYAEDRKSEQVFGERLFEFSLRTAIESGKTASVRALLYETGKRINLTDKNPNFTEAELAPLIQEMDRNGVAVKLAKDLVGDGRQGIISCIPGERNSHARLLAGILSRMKVNGRNIVAADIGSHIPREEQKRILKEYKEGKIDILTFTKTLEEGWDSDRASFCINLSPTTSPVKIKQLLGRIMRRKANAKESIFIDFIDRKFGLTKNQYTALHALEVEDIDVHRVIGRSHGGGGGARQQQELKDLSEIFEPGLYEQLTKSHGLLLEDVLITALENPVDPLIAEWNRRLDREKPPLPEELPHHPFFSIGVERRMGALARKLYRENGVEPTMQELYAAYGSPELHRMSRLFGLRVPLEDVVLDPSFEEDESEDRLAIRPSDYTTDPVDGPEGVAEYKELQGVVTELLKTLSEREAGVTRLRYGITDGIPRTVDETAQVYGVSPSRMRQIEEKTITKWRHPVRSEVLRPYSYADYQDEGELPPPVKSLPSVFDDISVPVFDRSDPRPYNARLEEASYKWLEAQKASLLKDPEVRVFIRKNVRPDHARIHNKVISSSEEARRHYEQAIQVIEDMQARLRPQKKGRSLQDLSLSPDELRFAVNSHKKGRVSAVTFEGDLGDFLKASTDVRISYADYLNILWTTPDNWWMFLDDKVPFTYNGGRVTQEARSGMVAKFGQQRAQLLKMQRSIEDRYYPEGSMASKQASLMVINAKLAFIEWAQNRVAEYIASAMGRKTELQL